ncbi:MAG: sulfite exporter TauE/SafE family protein [Anaerolineae bacterium]|nr:sulfite exporter TauE/SafE family protein [Anaerolineae bacterium]
MIFLALFLTGVAAGVLGAVLGLGGGVFLVPALHLLFDLPMRTAVACSIVGVLATSAGTVAFAPRGRGANVELALRLEIATTAGALAGSLVAGLLSSQALGILFAVVAFFNAGYTAYRARRRPISAPPEALFTHDYRPRRWGIGLSAGALAGMLSGLLGVGGGIIKVPVMYSVMEVPLGVATATSNFMVGITAAVSALVYYLRGDIYPVLAIPIALGVFAGATAGVWLLTRLRVGWVRAALIALLVIMGVQMLLRGLGLL